MATVNDYIYTLFSVFIFIIIIKVLKKYEVDKDIQDYNLLDKSLKTCYINKYKDHFEFYNKGHCFKYYNTSLDDFISQYKILKKVKIYNKIKENNSKDINKENFKEIKVETFKNVSTYRFNDFNRNLNKIATNKKTNISENDINSFSETLRKNKFKNLKK